MDREQEFDDLARRKLEEREHPFNEAHWELVREELGKRRRPTGGWYWSAAVVGLLLLGGGIWMVSGPDEASLAQRTPAERTIEALGTTGENHDAPAPNGGNTISRNVGDNVINDEQNDPEASAMEALHEVRASGPARQQKGHHAAGSTPISRSDRAIPSEPAAARMPAINDAAHAGTDGTIQHAGSLDEPGNAALTLSIAPSTTADIPMGPDMTSGPVVMVSDQDPTGAPQDGSPLPTEPAFDPADRTSNSAEAGTNASTASTPGDTASLPTSTSINLTLPFDSAGVEPAVTPPAPIVPHHAPWEVGIVAGAFNSYSRYTGGSSNDWSDNVAPLWSPGVGAEVMHVGRNVGLGLGLHYGTYAERITADAVDRNSVTYNPYWYLDPVDTTILHIIDTVQQGGETYYVGQSVNTTVMVLTQGTDTVTTTIRARDARTMTNRVSYLEIPLLLDAHVVQGRWSLGLRGGPSLGLLMGRQGELPNGTNDGYVALPDVPFREVVFGYTARAYVRYRFNAAWSVGIEPAIRGQFMNSLGEGTLERRTTSFGGVVSLSYRLP